MLEAAYMLGMTIDSELNLCHVEEVICRIPEDPVQAVKQEVRAAEARARTSIGEGLRRETDGLEEID
mgnify:CR=1 FL=1